MPNLISLTPGKRVLFLTKDLDLIRKQLYEGLDLRMEDLRVEDLLDDINTDVMTPAWVCFDHEPAMIAKNAYAGLMHNGLRVFWIKSRDSSSMRALGWDSDCYRSLFCSDSRTQQHQPGTVDGRP